MDNPKQSCSCHELDELKQITQQHTVQIAKHEERLGRGNIEFAVISTKLNIIMAIFSFDYIKIPSYCHCVVTNDRLPQNQSV